MVFALAIIGLVIVATGISLQPGWNSSPAATSETPPAATAPAQPAPAQAPPAPAKPQ
jgi:hypothetical protein